MTGILTVCAKNRVRRSGLSSWGRMLAAGFNGTCNRTVLIQLFKPGVDRFASRRLGQCIDSAIACTKADHGVSQYFLQSLEIGIFFRCRIHADAEHVCDIDQLGCEVWVIGIDLRMIHSKNDINRLLEHGYSRFHPIHGHKVRVAQRGFGLRQQVANDGDLRACDRSNQLPTLRFSGAIRLVGVVGNAQCHNRSRESRRGAYPSDRRRILQELLHAVGYACRQKTCKSGRKDACKPRAPRNVAGSHAPPPRVLLSHSGFSQLSLCAGNVTELVSA